MRVKIHLLSQSQPIVRHVVNAYTKDGFYCVLVAFHPGNPMPEAGKGGPQRVVEKYPLVNIFRVVEDYE